MKIGLLQCDHVREDLQHIAGDYNQMFPALFDQVSAEWEWKFYDVANNQFPENIDECDAYISTGSKFSVYDEEAWIVNFKEFVKRLYTAQKPYIGICFGHQMIGEALGGKVGKAPVGWCVGVHEFELHKNNIPASLQAIFEVVPSPFSLLMMCQDQILMLPPDTSVLASTPDCPNGMILVGKTILGIQAHPEFKVAYEDALTRTRIERIGEAKSAAALQSLSKPVHNIEIAQLINDFLKTVL